ncbi:MAG: hypothetical protein SCABRO_01817 [Candidatus Scalindua brodae]|uniref:Uncharacterized protein n=1 Tax=Candidatus Scalindua brodae TaxID=237368 RepID=A0A0B0EH50_9BACT|nr:MAG: hypothetical protein SCABRO_01817 [Candidatus Scalindua brodae]
MIKAGTKTPDFCLKNQDDKKSIVKRLQRQMDSTILLSER